MEKKVDPLKNIDARVHELEHTIHEREKQLKDRTTDFKKEFREQVSPEKLIRKYPFQSTGVSLLAGVLAGKVLRSILSPSPSKKKEPAPAKKGETAELKHAITSIGIDALRSTKDLAFTYFKHYLENKMKSGKGS